MSNSLNTVIQRLLREHAGNGPADEERRLFEQPERLDEIFASLADARELNAALAEARGVSREFLDTPMTL